MMIKLREATHKVHSKWMIRQRNMQGNFKEDRIKLLRDAEFPLNKQNERELPPGLYQEVISM